MSNKDKVIPFHSRTERGDLIVWDTASIAKALDLDNSEAAIKSAERAISSCNFPESLNVEKLVDEHDRPAKKVVLKHVIETAQRKRQLFLVMQYHQIDASTWILYTNDRRMADAG